MADKRWTFLCVSDNDNRVRQYSVSRGALHYAASVIGGVVVTVTAMAMMIVVDGSARFMDDEE